MTDVNLDENIEFAELFVKSIIRKLLQNNADGTRVLSFLSFKCI